MLIAIGGTGGRKGAAIAEKRRRAGRMAAMVLAGALLAACADSTGTTGGGSDTAEMSQLEMDLNAGFELLVAQDYLAAKNLFGKLAEEHPENATVALALGVSHHELGEFDEAEQQYVKAIQNGHYVAVKERIEDGVRTEEVTTIANLAFANSELLREERTR